MQQVAPAQPVPPHWPYRAAQLPVDGALLVAAAEVFVLVAKVVALDAFAVVLCDGVLEPSQLKTAGPGMV